MTEETYEVIVPTIPHSGGLVHASHFLEIFLKSVSSKLHCC